MIHPILCNYLQRIPKFLDPLSAAHSQRDDFPAWIPIGLQIGGDKEISHQTRAIRNTGYQGITADFPSTFVAI